jgi:micrococcal nuclease
MESKQEGGAESAKFLSQLIPIGSKVIIVDVGRELYGRILGVVFAKKNINLEMVKNGYAIIYQQYLSKCPSMRQDLVKAVREAMPQASAIAKNRKLNIWNKPNFCSPQNFRQNTAFPAVMKHGRDTALPCPYGD